MLAFIAALIGGLIIWQLRDHDQEAPRWVWVLASALLALALTFVTGGGYVSAVFVAALAALFWTMPNGQTLRGPSQDFDTADSDPILRGVLTVFPANAGTTLGWHRWLAYNGLRTVLPCVLVGVALPSSPHMLVVGVLCVAAYWPFGHALARRLNADVEFVGAGLSGAAFYAGLAL